MNLRFTKEAATEVEEAHAWYEARRAGLGAAFRQELARTMDAIVESPEMFAEVGPRMRRAMLRRFPYIVLYESLPDVVLVLGVLHGARDPRGWRERGSS